MTAYRLGVGLMRAGRYAHSAQNFDRYITVTSTYIIRGNLIELKKICYSLICLKSNIIGLSFPISDRKAGAHFIV